MLGGKIVRQEQTAGEPYHWSLFLAREGQPGVVLQVKGDAVAMQYAHTNNITKESVATRASCYTIKHVKSGNDVLK